MKRVSAPLLLAVLVAVLLPVPAVDQAVAGTTTGFVTTAVVSAVPQKTLHNANGGPNGVFGYVIPLSSEGSYTLTRTGAVGHLDAYFFKAGSDSTKIGDSCSQQNHDDAIVTDPGFATDQLFDVTESGVICPGSDVGKWAVIVARTGSNVNFTFTH